MSYKVKYRDGTEEVINKAKNWYVEDGFVLFEDEKETHICAIHSDLIAKIE